MRFKSSSFQVSCFLLLNDLHSRLIVELPTHSIKRFSLKPKFSSHMHLMCKVGGGGKGARDYNLMSASRKNRDSMSYFNFVEFIYAFRLLSYTYLFYRNNSVNLSPSYVITKDKGKIGFTVSWAISHFEAFQHRSKLLVLLSEKLHQKRRPYWLFDR